MNEEASSSEFLKDLRARWDRRQRERNAAKQQTEAVDEPIYDEIYREAMETMALEEGTGPSPDNTTPAG